jgi:hypothetical protein
MFSDAGGLPADKWQWAFDPDYIWVIRILLPFVLTFLNTTQSIGVLTPMFLGFVPLLLVAEIRKKTNFSPALHKTSMAALATLLLWLLTFFTIMEIRYVFFLWIILYMPVAETIAVVFESRDFPLRKVLILAVSTLMIFNILRVTALSLDTYSPLDDKGNPQCRGHEFCDYLKPISEEAPQGARVLALSAFRYYLRTDLFVCSTFGDEYQLLHDASLKSADAFWEEAYRQGYSYVAYEANYSIRHLYIDFVPTPENTPSWMELTPMYAAPGDVAVAYRIKVTNPPVEMEKACMMNSNGVWEVQLIGESNRTIK